MYTCVYIYILLNGFLLSPGPEAHVQEKLPALLWPVG